MVADGCLWFHLASLLMTFDPHQDLRRQSRFTWRDGCCDLQVAMPSSGTAEKAFGAISTALELRNSCWTTFSAIPRRRSAVLCTGAQRLNSSTGGFIKRHQAYPDFRITRRGIFSCLADRGNKHVQGVEHRFRLVGILYLGLLPQVCWLDLTWTNWARNITLQDTADISAGSYVAPRAGTVLAEKD